MLHLICSAQTDLQVRFGEWHSQKFATYKGDTTSYRLSMLSVPENRLASKTSIIQLKVVVFPSKTGSNLSPLVFLAGGPGQSGVNYLRQEFFQKPIFKLQENHDVILLDQRGQGQACLLWSTKFHLPI